MHVNLYYLCPMSVRIMPWILFLFVLASCSRKSSDYTKAEDALDAGRQYIQACLEGDFAKAAFYTLPDSGNKVKLDSLEKIYRSLDREGRQQLRTASININEVKESAAGTEMVYSNSFEKEPHRIVIVQKEKQWLVNLIP
jgi:hypothetical protein